MMGMKQIAFQNKKQMAFQLIHLFIIITGLSSPFYFELIVT